MPQNDIKMAKEVLYAQLDIEKLREIEEKTDEKISLIEKIFLHIKYFIAEYLPEPLANLMMGEIGDIVVIVLFLIILSVILKILGFAFKIIWRVFIILLFLASIYILYLYYFS